MNLTTKLSELIKLVVSSGKTTPPRELLSVANSEAGTNPETEKKEREEIRSKLDAWFDLSVKVHRDEKQDARKSLDQNLLSLSSGALALTLAFMNYIHKHMTHWNWLFLSWVLFVATISVTLVSYLLSELASSQKVDQVEKAYYDALEAYKFEYTKVGDTNSCDWKKELRDFFIKLLPSGLIDLLNVGSLVCFVIGLGILSFVCWTNFAIFQEFTAKEKTIEKRENFMSEPEKKPIFEQKPARKPDGDRHDEGLTPSNTKPLPIPPKPQPKPQPDSKPSDTKRKMKSGDLKINCVMLFDK